MQTHLTILGPAVLAACAFLSSPVSAQQDHGGAGHGNFSRNGGQHDHGGGEFHGDRWDHRNHDWHGQQGWHGGYGYARGFGYGGGYYHGPRYYAPVIYPYYVSTGAYVADTYPAAYVAPVIDPGVIPSPETYVDNDSGSYCRQFSQVISVNGRPSESYGTACLQPDGTWRVVQ